LSNFAWILIIVGVLTLVGGGALLIVTFKYYWGERGTPPVTVEPRRRQKEEELRLRAKQFEYAKKHPIKTRKPDFFDNSKVS
jgi:hypothetical protein